MGKPQESTSLEVRQRAGKWWALSKPRHGPHEERGPFTDRAQAEVALLDIAGVTTGVQEDPITGKWVMTCTTLGKSMPPLTCPSKLDAELMAKRAMDEIRNMLGLGPAPGPEVRQADPDVAMSGTYVDYNQQNATRPPKALEKPEDFLERYGLCKELATRAVEMGGNEMDLLLAAYSLMEDRNPIGFTSRARAVVAWCEKDHPQTELEVLEWKARDLATLIADRIGPADQFVLMLSNSGDQGHFTHIGSMDRATIINLVGEYVTKLKADYQRRS